MFYTGCVENRNDPLMLGRCQVRIVGLHTHDKIDLPTEDLPWAHPMGPITSASISGLGWSPTGIVPGTWVIVIFLDEYHQQPIILGTIGGIPQTKSASILGDSTNGVVTTSNDGELISSVGGGDITEIVDALGRAGTLFNDQPIDETETYSIVPVITETSEGLTTTFNVVNKNGNVVVATSYFDNTTNSFLVELSNPETWSVSQQQPFKSGPMSFQSTQAIAEYFEVNYK